MRVFYLLLFMLISSCSSTSSIDRSKLEGKYVLDGDFYGLGSELNIIGDNKFEYRWQEGLINGMTNGNYSINKNEIIFNSEFQPNDKEFQNKYRIVESKYKNTESIKIKVISENNHVLEYANCFLKKGDSIVYGAASDEKGFAELSKINADSLCVSFISHDYVSIALETLKDDYLVIELNEKNPDFEFYHFFSNEKFKYRGNKLIGTSEKFKKKN